jgi:ribosome-binding factor A
MKREQVLHDAILTHLSEAFRREFSDPLFSLLTITELKLTTDYQFADLWVVSVRPGDQPGTVLRKLKQVSGVLRTHLAKALRMKRVPQLRWHYNRQGIEEQKIEAILERSKTTHSS